jgi:hypothetical protein
MDQLFALGHVYTGLKILELALYEIMLATLPDGPWSTLTRRTASTRIIANALNTASTSREIRHEFRYHAKVLNDHLADVLRSGLYDDIDHFFRMLEALGRNRSARIVCRRSDR